MGLLAYSPWKTTEPILNLTRGHIKSYKTRNEMETRGIIGWTGEEAILSRRPIQKHPNELLLDGKKIIRDYNSFSYTKMSPLGDTTRGILWRLTFTRNPRFCTRVNAMFAIWKYHVSPLLYVATVMVFFIEANIIIKLMFLVMWATHHVIFLVMRPHLFLGFLYCTIIPFSLVNWLGQTLYLIKRTDTSFEVLKQASDVETHPRHGHHFQDEDINICNIT